MAAASAGRRRDSSTRSKIARYRSRRDDDAVSSEIPISREA
ncbi:hypothetical protein [Promicromonospora aerolata]|uniref:Uncharacterized protein n=1 Tax=Promicromonospora aerolata TaxID=195749 RepID=A0ABW4V630_9MICO